MIIFKKNKRFNLKVKKGFTLVEVLLYVCIMSVMMLVLSAFLFFILQSNVKSQTISELEIDGDRAMQIMLQTIRNASSVSTPTFGNSGTSLTLVVSDGAKSPTIFSLVGGAVMIKEGTGAQVPLTSSRVIVSGLNFVNTAQNSTTGSIKVQFTMTHYNPSGRNEYDWVQNFFGSATIR